MFEQGHGILRDGIKENSESEVELSRRTLMQDINRHAAVVLEGRTLGKQLHVAAMHYKQTALPKKKKNFLDFDSRRS